MNNKYMIFEGKAYEFKPDGLFQGWIPVMPPIPQGRPGVNYVGAKIPIDPIWKQILSFLRWGYTEFKSEVQLRLYYNTTENIWKPWAFPQEEGTGMTTKEIPEKCDEECKKRGLFSKNGWFESGSVHSHCASSAFQSPTDKDNEKGKSGIHITVGKLDEGKYDLDGRVSYRGTFYGVNWEMWFAMPPNLEGLPYHFREDVLKFFLTEKLTEDEEGQFPEEWKANVINIKPIYKGTVYDGYRGGYPSHGGYVDGKWVANVKSYWDRLKDQNAKKDLTLEDLAKSRLSKKESKTLLRLMNKCGIKEVEYEPRDTESKDWEEDWEKEEEAKVRRAAMAIINLCESENIDYSDLELWSMNTAHMADEKKKKVVDEMDAILSKEGVHQVEVEQLFDELRLKAEDLKTEEVKKD